MKERLAKFPILTLTGPRQSGKSTLLKNSFPEYAYFNLERLDYQRLIKNDPIGFLQNQGEKIIFDEAQRVPELFNYIQVISDERNTPGQYILSGSQSFLLNNYISQSLAGRTSVNRLFPFDMNEIGTTDSIIEAIFKGFYPRIYDYKIEPTEFYPPYIQTYIERDVRSLKSIENLTTFSRFLGLCAGRIGQVLNLTSLANDTGISVNTAKSWLSLLEASFILFTLQPYYKNFSKRLIKSPKIYFYDTGLVCSLLNIQSVEMIQTHYLYGALFENFIIAEIMKLQAHNGKKSTLYFWRDNNGVELDCLVERGNGQLCVIEIKGGATINQDYLKHIKRFNPDGIKTEKYVIYTGKETINIGNVNIIGQKDMLSCLKSIAE